MKPFILILFALLVPAQQLHAAAALTVDEAITAALKNHPLAIEAGEYLYGAEARTGQALSNYYPQISIAADWNRGRTYLAALQGIRTTEVTTAALYLKQTIYDFGRTSGVVDAARYNRDAADKALAITRQDLALRVRSAFYLLLAAQKQVAAVRETVNARTQVHRQAQEFFSQGVRAKLDVARAEANLYAAGTALIRAENNRDIARVELANAMGMDSLGERTPAEPAPAPLRQWPERSLMQQEALRNRAELKQLVALTAAASATLKTAKGSYLPVLSATGSIGYADQNFPPAGNVWGVGLNLSMPLFSGFSSVEQVREAGAAINATEARRNGLRLQIIKEVESAWLGGNEAAARISSTEKEVAAAGESRALAEGRYQEGIGSIIEVAEAQSLALDAQTAHIQATYDYYITTARLDRAVGKE